jgi:hypothetical protein
VMIFHLRRGKADRTSARARSRSRCTTSAGNGDPFADECKLRPLLPRRRGQASLQ